MSSVLNLLRSNDRLKPTAAVGHVVALSFSLGRRGLAVR